MENVFSTNQRNPLRNFGAVTTELFRTSGQRSGEVTIDRRWIPVHHVMHYRALLVRSLGSFIQEVQ
jgi:hypothetical protein